jgi:glutathione S-transferase
VKSISRKVRNRFLPITGFCPHRQLEERIVLLRYSSHSPYVRKVLLVAHELGIAHLLTSVPTALRVANDESFWRENPLAKIPVLTLESGESYFDSKVICEYLDAKFGNGSLLPSDSELRWQALTMISLADGIVDAGMLARQESLRAEHLRDPKVIELQLGKVARGLDKVEQVAAAGGLSAQFDMVGIAVAGGLGWLIMRFGAELILGSRPALASWYEQISQRPSMLATDHEHAEAAAKADAGKSSASGQAGT